MTDVLLIPSAILVPDELRLDLGRIPTGMIPIQGKPMLKLIVDAYDEADVYVACDAAAEQIYSYIRREKRVWETIDVAGSRSLADTVYRSLVQIEQDRGFDFEDTLRLNFADTLVEPTYPPSDVDWISYDVVSNPVRWTTFETDERDRISKIVQKFDPSVQDDQRVFTGVFSIEDPVALREHLQRSTETNASSPSPFFRALEAYLSTREYDLVRAETWTDVGHLDTYHRAKRRSMNVREFNQIGVLDDENIVRKTSDRVETLASEYRWYQQIPDEIRPFTPQIYGFSTDERYLELEYVGYPSLSDIHLYGSHGLHIWKGVFESLLTMLDVFARTTETGMIEESLHEMYVQKTRQRLDAVDRDGHLAPFFEEQVTINGVQYLGVPVILDELVDELQSAGVLTAEEFTIIHGDPCFSNIMYDIRSGILKLIDPRGEFGDHVVFGDQRYDCAKMLHSVLGCYDFVINDLFDVTVDDGCVEYEVFTDERHRKRQTLFENLFTRRFPETYEQIEIIESLLFLSMVPLHGDEPSRQVYMLSRGVERFNNCVYDIGAER